MAFDRATEIQRLATHYTPGMVRFLRDMIAIPSESADERAVIHRVGDEMAAAGVDEVKTDGLGNILGRVGSGRTIVARAWCQKAESSSSAEPITSAVSATLSSTAPNCRNSSSRAKST